MYGDFRSFVEGTRFPSLLQCRVHKDLRQASNFKAYNNVL